MICVSNIINNEVQFQKGWTLLELESINYKYVEPYCIVIYLTDAWHCNKEN